MSELITRYTVALDPFVTDSSTKAEAQLRQWLTNPAFDLIIVSQSLIGTSTVEQLAGQFPDRKITIIGDGPNPKLVNVRRVSNQREQAAFIAASLVTDPKRKESIGFLTDTPRVADDAEWKGVQEGIHYAGSPISPTMLLTSDIQGLSVAKVQQIHLTTIIAADQPLPEVLTKLTSAGKRVVLLHRNNNKSSGNVIMTPRSYTISGIEEEVGNLVGKKWVGQQTIDVPSVPQFAILQPPAFPYPDVNSRYVTLVDLLSNGALRPADFQKTPNIGK